MGDPTSGAGPFTSPAAATGPASLRAIAKFKARSHDTSKQVHIPLLQARASQDLPGPEVVLLGDSMFERMTTTGACPNLVAPWPSPAMLDDTALAGLGLEAPARLERVFNAGVGGDRIQNVAYRLVGENGHDHGGETAVAGRELPGLLPLLARFGSVRLWVVQAGTNNLSPKKGLADPDRDALAVLVRALLRAGLTGRQGGCRVLVTGLFHRKDVSRQLVDEANEKVAGVVRELNKECGRERVFFLPAAGEVRTTEHLEDHVHLSLPGYRLWAKELFPVVVGLLRKGEDEETG